MSLYECNWTVVIWMLNAYNDVFAHWKKIICLRFNLFCQCQLKIGYITMPCDAIFSIEFFRYFNGDEQTFHGSETTQKSYY